MTPQDFFVVFGVSPYAVAAYVLLHLHIVAIGRRVTRIENNRRLTRHTSHPERPPMDSVKIERLKVLQNIPVDQLHPVEAMELEQLRRELAQRPELPDDPSTLTVDESARPNIEGGDYMKDRDTSTKMRETVSDVREAVGFFAWVIRLFRGGGR